MPFAGERGGGLFGRWTDSRRLDVATLTTDVVDGSSRPFSMSLDVDSITGRQRDFGTHLDLVGSWHTHGYEGAIANPSSTDFATWCSWLAERRLDAFLGLIATPSHDRERADYAWLGPIFSGFLLVRDDADRVDIEFPPVQVEPIPAGVVI